MFKLSSKAIDEFKLKIKKIIGPLNEKLFSEIKELTQ